MIPKDSNGTTLAIGDYLRGKDVKHVHVKVLRFIGHDIEIRWLPTSKLGPCVHYKARSRIEQRSPKLFVKLEPEELI